MKWRTVLWGSGALAALLLAGCAPVLVRKPGTPSELAAQATRERVLGAKRDWGLHARFAASNGHRGGSGSLDWRQQGARYRLTLRAPITGKTVRLVGGPDGAVLAGLKGGPLAGANASAVLNAAFGWRVPVDDLAYWVRGLRAPGDPAQLLFGANGLPSVLEQDGWHVEYRGWYASREPPLPRKVYASRDPFTVRVLIKSWGSGK